MLHDGDVGRATAGESGVQSPERRPEEAGEGGIRSVVCRELVAEVPRGFAQRRGHRVAADGEITKVGECVLGSVRRDVATEDKTSCHAEEFVVNEGWCVEGLASECCAEVASLLEEEGVGDDRGVNNDHEAGLLSILVSRDRVPLGVVTVTVGADEVDAGDRGRLGAGVDSGENIGEVRGRRLADEQITHVCREGLTAPRGPHLEFVAGGRIDAPHLNQNRCHASILHRSQGAMGFRCLARFNTR